MQLVAKRKDGSLFRAISLPDDIEAEKQIMTDSAEEELEFEIMIDEEFEQYLESLPKPPQLPTTEERIAELEAENMMNMLALVELHALILSLGGDSK